MTPNLTYIEPGAALPWGAMTFYECADETEAAYYANGRRGYLYRSMYVPVMYLLVPLCADMKG